VLLQPLVGLEWAFADHASVSGVVRLPILLGTGSTFGLSASVPSRTPVASDGASSAHGHQAPAVTALKGGASTGSGPA
jgi:hypothetical protein